MGKRSLFLLHSYFYLKFLTQRISPTSVLGQVQWMLAVVHYYKLKWRIVALKSSARRCHSVSIPLPVNSMRLHLKHAVGKGLTDYPSLSLKVCCTVSRSLYPLLPKRICPKWTTMAISLGQSAHGAPSSFVPGEEGLTSCGFCLGGDQTWMRLTSRHATNTHTGFSLTTCMVKDSKAEIE